MDRITEKLDNGYYRCVDEYWTWEGGIRQTQVIGRYEDIEEMLGMDLISAVELCKKANEQHYVYVQESWGLYKVEFLDDLDIQLFNHCLYTNHRGVWYSFDLKEYGITWWLKED